MSDSNRSQLFYAVETAYNQVPATAFKTARFTQESLDYAITNTQSKEIRPDRQIVDLIQTDAKSSGTTDHELSFASFDDFLAAMLFSAPFGVDLTLTGTNIGADSTDSSLNLSVGNFPAYAAGQFISIAGFATAGNNGIAQVVSNTGPKLVLSGLTLTTEAAAASVTLKGNMVRNGTTLTSFTIEKFFSDVGHYFHYTGMIVDKGTFKISSQAVLTAQLNWMGSNSTESDATLSTGAASPANANSVMNSTSNVAKIFEGGNALTGVHFKDLQFDVNNNLRARLAVGSLTPTDYGTGEFQVTGQCQAYFADPTLYQKYLNGTESSLAVIIKDGAGNAYVVSFPRIKYTAGKIVASGANSDVMAAMSFQAIRDKVNGYTMQIDKLAA